MTKTKIKKLQSGDEVFWTDPDDGQCSRTLVIQSIGIHGDVVQITDKGGDFLECFTNELS